MPGKIKVKILAGRNLPVMDRSGDTTDAYVELKFGNVTFKTDVCRKSLNPQWNSEWYKFEVDDAELQDEPLQIRLMDHDTYSANDAIGKVYINLNPLLLLGVPPAVRNIWTLEAAMNTTIGSQGGSVMTGWIPVYDTMHGIRGEVNIIVKVELFSDFNKFRQSSCGVQFFYSPNIPYGYHTQSIHGFVEELIVSDDPEYKWIDKIRTPRASNEARQTLFFKLSGEVQRKIGLKALDLGGNAVIGYLQNFDLEGESGIVARGIGTAVTLVKLQDTFNLPSENLNLEEAAFAFFSQSKAQAERKGINENIQLFPTIVSCIPDPVMKENRIACINDRWSHYKAMPSNAKLAMKDLSNTKEEKSSPVFLKSNPLSPRLKKSPNSSVSLAESVVDDASVRMMLALEDIRGEYTRSKLDVRLKNLKKLFGTGGEIESRQDSIAKLNTIIKSNSARPSLANISYPAKEKSLKHSKSAGEGIAALLIKSIHSVPLNNVQETCELSTCLAAISDKNKSCGCSEVNENTEGRLKLDKEADEDTDEIQPNNNEVLNDKEKKDLSAVNNEIYTARTNVSDTDNGRQNKMYAVGQMIDRCVSSEESTSSSENDFSNDSTGYDILRDSTYSIDDEVDSKYNTTLTRAATFPLTKHKTPQVQLQRVEIDAFPLTKESTLSIAKYPSACDIFSDVKAEFNTNRIDKLCQIQGDGVKDFSSPLATSTPTEIRHSFFTAEENSGILNISKNKNDKILERCKSIKKTDATNATKSISDHRRKLNKVHSEVARSKTEVPDHHQLNRIKSSRARFAKTRNDSKFGISLHIDETDNGSLYTKELEPSTLTPSNESKEKKFLPARLNTNQSATVSPILTKKTRREFHKDTKLKFKRYEYLSNTFAASTNSLTSLQHSLAHPSKIEKSHDKKHYGDKNIKKSFESLIQSPNNDTFDPRKDRRNRMLELIQIIDTKMMVQSAHHGNNAARLKRKKKDKMYKNIHCVESQHQLSKKQLERCATIDVICESSVPKDLSLVESTVVPPRTNSFSCKLSLESIISRDTHRSRLSKQAELSRSKPSVLVKRSTIDQGISSHDIAKELTSKIRNIDSFRDCSNIEMKELKSRNTNNLPCPSLTSVGPTIHKSHSDFNVRQVSDEFTNNTNTANITYNSCVSRPYPNHRQQDEASLSPSYPLPMVSKVCQSPVIKAQAAAPPLHRRSSDSDLSVTPKGNSLGGSDRSMGGLMKPSTAVIRAMNQDALEMLEYPFITMQQYPPGFILHIGGLVSSRSVKLLERISNLEEPEGRDAWWTEIRMEVRSHARALACNVVIGYREETSICDDVCVLNASGTAAVINLHSSNQDVDSLFTSRLQSGTMTGTAEVDREKIQQKSMVTKPEKIEGDTSVPVTQPTGKVRHMSEGREHETFSASFQTKCNLCHLPYSETSVPFKVNVSKCGICRRAKVPDVMFTTIELPENIPTTGRGCFIQSTVCKSKKDLRGELNAKEISDCLPFLEYELHSLLLNKLKVKGMNAIFGLKLQVSVGERLIIGMAVGTAVFLTALPAPSVPQIASGNSWHNEEQLAEIQKTLVETAKKNREFYRLKSIGDVENGRVATSDTDESDEDLPDLDFSIGARDACILEVDDIEDMDRISLLMDDRPPDDFHVVNTQTIPGLDDLEIVRNLQMFTQISRAKIPTGQVTSMPSKYFARLLQSVYFKLRRMVPCALCDMQFKLALPEQDEIQFMVVGMALGLGEPIKLNKAKKKIMTHSVSKDQVKKSDDSDMIFSLDVDHNETLPENVSTTGGNVLPSAPPSKFRPRSPLRTKVHAMHKHKHVPLKGRYGVDITPLSYLPGGRIERYLGNLNFFFIRESTSIRENGGLSGFTHSFVMEVLAIVRAHITALGGNAMVAFFMTQCVLLHSPHKNQGQCLINVGGDVVSVSYFADEKHSTALNC